MNADRRSKPAFRGDRQLISAVRFDDFALGMIEYGMMMQAPDDASADYLRGREEARQTAISEVLTGEVE